MAWRMSEDESKPRTPPGAEERAPCLLQPRADTASTMAFIRAFSRFIWSSSFSVLLILSFKSCCECSAAPAPRPRETGIGIASPPATEAAAEGCHVKRACRASVWGAGRARAYRRNAAPPQHRTAPQQEQSRARTMQRRAQAGSKPPTPTAVAKIAPDPRA